MITDIPATLNELNSLGRRWLGVIVTNPGPGGAWPLVDAGQLMCASRARTQCQLMCAIDKDTHAYTFHITHYAFLNRDEICSIAIILRSP